MTRVVGVAATFSCAGSEHLMLASSPPSHDHHRIGVERRSTDPPEPTVSRVAFVFPGQGSQKPGMASAWMPAAAELFRRLSEATGLDLPGDADDADAVAASTSLGQPSITSVSLAALAALTEAGVRADVVAGHSLGEVTAAAAAGVLTPEAAASVVAARGRAMGQACRATPGAMAAVVRLDVAEVERLVADLTDVVVANVNSPQQTVLAGTPDGVERAREVLSAAGARVLPLPVEGAFHSPAMTPAVHALQTALQYTATAEPTVPLLSGLDGRPRRSADEVRTALVDGVLAPVRWVDVQHALVADGVELALEVGPGGVLAGLARRTVEGLTVLSVATPDDLPAALAAVEELRAAHAA
jgi:[acyl-carrier-protein] S-malonyltransferase